MQKTMSKTQITFTPEFQKEYKRLAKKYISVKTDVQTLVAELQENPTLGISLGRGAYKIRMAITTKNKGKSGGARVITYFWSEENELYLISIYDKSEETTMTGDAINERIDIILG